MPKIATRTFHARRFAQPWVATINYDPKKQVFSIRLPKELEPYHGTHTIEAKTQEDAETAAGTAVRKYDEAAEITRRVICYEFEGKAPSHGFNSGMWLGFFAVVVDETEMPGVDRKGFAATRYMYEEVEGNKLNRTEAANRWRESIVGGSFQADKPHSPQVPHTPEAEAWFLRMAEAMQTLGQHLDTFTDTAKTLEAIAAGQMLPRLDAPRLRAEMPEHCPGCGEILAPGAQVYSCDLCESACCTACSHNHGRHGVICEPCHAENESHDDEEDTEEQETEREGKEAPDYRGSPKATPADG